MIETPYDYLMNICTVCYLICYVPDLYANYINKNANIWNIPEKVLIFVGTGFALAFAVVTEDKALLANFAPLFVLDGASMGMRTYYACRNRQRQRYLEMPAEGGQGPKAANVSAQDSNTAPSSDGPTRETTGLDSLEVR
jgi:hypothetical protein